MRRHEFSPAQEESIADLMPLASSQGGGRCVRQALRSVGFVILLRFILLRLIVMPLDGEEHARSQHDNLEWKEDHREPVIHFEHLQAMTLSIVKET